MKNKMCPHCGRPWLTVRQVHIFMYIRNYIDLKGVAPTQAEMRTRFQWTGVAAAHYALKRLQQRGVLTVNEFVPRGITITELGRKLEA